MICSFRKILKLQRFHHIISRPVHVYSREVWLFHITLCGQNCNILDQHPLPDDSHQRHQNGIYDLGLWGSLIFTRPTYHLYTRQYHSYPITLSWHDPLSIQNGKLEYAIRPFTKGHYTYERDNKTTKRPSYHIRINGRIPHVSCYRHKTWSSVYDLIFHTILLLPYQRAYKGC